MAQSNYSTAVMADSPVAYYKMDEASGQPQDSSGNGYHFTSTSGTPEYQFSGPMQGSYAIQFVNENFSRAVFSTATDNITIEFWYTRDSIGSGTLVYNGGTNYVAVNDYSQSGYGYARILSSSTEQHRLRCDEWSHIVAVFRAGVWELWLNGVKHSSGGTTTFSTPTGGTGVGNGGSSNTVRISNYAYYNTALSEARIIAHYDAAMDRPQPPTNTYAQEVMVDTPVAFYKLDEASGLPQDSSGNAYHMTNSWGDAPTYQEAGPFSGSYAYGIHQPPTSEPIFARSSIFNTFYNDITIEFWIKGKDPYGSRLCRNGSTIRNFDIDLDVTTKEITVVVNAATEQDPGPKVTDTWRMFTATYKDSTPIWKYYWDGDLYDESAGTTVPGTASGTFTLIYIANLGADFSISNISMYTTELSAARIKAHYNAAIRYIPSYQRVSQGARLNG